MAEVEWSCLPVSVNKSGDLFIYGDMYWLDEYEAFGKFNRIFSKIPNIVSFVRKFHRNEFVREIWGTEMNDLSISLLTWILKVERDPPIMCEIMLTYANRLFATRKIAIAAIKTN